MVTAESIFTQANMVPTDFGKVIIPPTITIPSEQRDLALAHIEGKILPAATSEVLGPLMKASGGYFLPFPDSVIIRKYPLKEGDPTGIVAITDQIQALYDAAVTAYAQSEINNQISTNQKSYDEDSSQDRKVADARLEKLLDMVNDIVFGSPEPPTATSGTIPDRRASLSVQNVYSF